MAARSTGAKAMGIGMRRAWRGRWLPRLAAFLAILAVFVDVLPSALAESWRQHGSEREIARLLRDIESLDGAEAQAAALRTLLAERFPAGSSAAALIAFLGDGGPDWRLRFSEPFGDAGGRGIYCHLAHGSMTALLLGPWRWRYREWVISIALRDGKDEIAQIGARVPMFGKG